MFISGVNALYSPLPFFDPSPFIKKGIIQDILTLKSRQPPIKFWEYARGEQRKHNYFMEEDARPAPRSRRHTEYPLNRNSLLKEQALSELGLNRSNTTLVDRVEKVSYENIRKGQRVDPSVNHSWFRQQRLDDVAVENTLPNIESCKGYKMERRRSRTLVKQRQPWDKAPRTSVGDARWL